MSQQEEDIIQVVDPGGLVAADRRELDKAYNRVLESGWYILGNEVTSFERKFAAWNECRGAIGVATGTDAVKLSLMALGVGHGDSVVTVSHTAVATAMAICDLGARPVFCDVEESSRCMCPDDLRRAITPQTKAIVAVHIYGHPCNMDKIMEIAEEHDIPVVEDCAQAHGARWRGRRVGNFGALGAFSFYPTKNLGGIGDGGAIISNDEVLLEKLKYMHQYGWKERYISSEFGVNSRLDELQAAFLKVGLRHLQKRNENRRAIASRYLDALEHSSLAGPREEQDAEHVYHLFVVESDERDRVREYLHSKGIRTSVQYPQAVHKQSYFQNNGLSERSLPRTEKLYSRIISIPMHPLLDDVQVERICQVLRSI